MLGCCLFSVVATPRYVWQVTFQSSTKRANHLCPDPGKVFSNGRSSGGFDASKPWLLNTQVARAEEPVEILRTLHSFDPCLACSTHVISEDGEELTTVKVR